jgi:hypothetical protein
VLLGQPTALLPAVSASCQMIAPSTTVGRRPQVPTKTVVQSSEVKAAALKAAEPSPARDVAVPSQLAAETATEGRASVTSAPDGADIFIDSVGSGRTPALLRLKPGKHSVQVVYSGYKDWVSEVEVKAGSIVNVTATLQK